MRFSILVVAIDQHLLGCVEFYVPPGDIVFDEIVNKHATCVTGCWVYRREIFRMQLASHRSVRISSGCTRLSLLVLLYNALILLVATPTPQLANLSGGFGPP